MYPGKVDAFLEYQQERRLHEKRSNASILAKRRHLEEFIAKNKARASTASRAKSKSKQLESWNCSKSPVTKTRPPFRGANCRAAPRTGTNAARI